MLAHGDELGRTQRGNNNVYAQDNEISWVDWDLDADQQGLLEFTSAAIAPAQGAPGAAPPAVLRRRRPARRPEPARRHRLAQAGRRRDERQRLGHRLLAVADGVPQRRRDPRDRQPGPPHHRRPLPADVQRQLRVDHLHHAGEGVRRGLDRAAEHRDRRRRPRRSSRGARAASTRSRRTRWSCSPRPWCPESSRQEAEEPRRPGPPDAGPVSGQAERAGLGPRAPGLRWHVGQPAPTEHEEHAL